MNTPPQPGFSILCALRTAFFAGITVCLTALGACSGGGGDGDGSSAGSSQIKETWQAELAVESIADWVVEDVLSGLEDGSYDAHLVGSPTGGATITGKLSSGSGGSSNHVWTTQDDEVVIDFDNYTATREAGRYAPDSVTITGTVYFRSYGRSDQYGSGTYTSTWRVNVLGQEVTVRLSDDKDKDFTFEGKGDFQATGKLANNLVGQWTAGDMTLEF